MPWLDQNDWPDDEILTLKELMLRLVTNPAEQAVAISEGDEESESELLKATKGIPSILPILPLRGLVVYPETAVPLTIGQPRSIRLVDDVVASDSRLIGLVTSRDPELEIP